MRGCRLGHQLQQMLEEKTTHRRNRSSQPLEYVGVGRSLRARQHLALSFNEVNGAVNVLSRDSHDGIYLESCLYFLCGM